MWYFRKKGRGEKIRDPIQGEFFATEAIASPAEALVRESIQNSLDAGDGNAVRVRMYLGRGEAALYAKSAETLFNGAWQHYSAESNGLRDAPKPSDHCPYLVVEDFGTSGLTGDPRQSDPLPGVVNPFFLFFRAEGLSGKGEKERGRWGVGKYVFPRSSLISSHFGLTVRKDDGRELLMGAATLKSHVVDGQTYCPDGLFGALESDDFVLPLDDERAIKDFRQSFSISRQSEPGLSVVVPYVDPDITFEELLLAAAKDYFLPILDGTLEVTIESHAEQAVLTSRSLSTTLDQYRERIGADVPALVELARWAGTATDDTRFETLTAGEQGSPKWTDDLIPDAVRDAVRRRIDAHEPFAVRVWMMIRPKGGQSERTYFDILMRPDRDSDGKPRFVRDGIMVSDVKGGRAREFLSLVVVTHKPLATMLGDSENPAHTQWQKDSSNFRGKYTYGPGSLDFVTSAVSSLMKAVNRSENDEDPSLTVDFFSLPAEDDNRQGADPDKRKKKKRKPDVPPVDLPRPRPAQIKISRRAGGFSVAAGPGAPPPPFIVEVRAAYDVRNGNPLKKYDPADFDFSRSGIDVVSESRGLTIGMKKDNIILARVAEADFRLCVDGFDKARDVYVKATVRTPGDADSQT
jgi:hypothetical protein